MQGSELRNDIMRRNAAASGHRKTQSRFPLSLLRSQIGGQGGQPALLYLVPCVLGTVLALAYSRSQLRELWYALQRAQIGPVQVCTRALLTFLRA